MIRGFVELPRFGREVVPPTTACRKSRTCRLGHEVLQMRTRSLRWCLALARLVPHRVHPQAQRVAPAHRQADARRHRRRGRRGHRRAERKLLHRRRGRHGIGSPHVGQLIDIRTELQVLRSVAYARRSVTTCSGAAGPVSTDFLPEGVSSCWLPRIPFLKLLNVVRRRRERVHQGKRVSGLQRQVHER